ncbi:DUF4328 domain-containing protein [Sphingobacterium sp. LRF_L2]|uniref:DUF4328 domain-containing protein n=1 Tax=Sphingobacterium sp. LRF_L2 TaxID=3369421 RepID=UPI003F608F4B
MTTTVLTEHQEALRPNAQRAKNVILVLKFILALEFIGIFLNYLQYEMLSVPEISEEAANSSDSRRLIFGILYAICFIAGAVTFIQWFRRAYYNLSLRDSYLSHTDKDAAYCWFIPVLNLFKPYQIMKDMYVKTADLLESRHPDIKEGLSIPLLTTWWIFWIVNNFAGQLSFRLMSKADTILDLIEVTFLDIAINLISIPLTLLAIRVIQRYAKAEELLKEIPEDDNEWQIAAAEDGE